MAKPNYSFAKRQRELAKKKKKEEKRQRKSADQEEGVEEGVAPGTEGSGEATTAESPAKDTTPE
jgi:hypothetical protein